MIFSYQDCIQKYKSAYQIKKAVAEGEIYLIEKGIYSDISSVHYLDIINKKYPYSIFFNIGPFFSYLRHSCSKISGSLPIL